MGYSPRGRKELDTTEVPKRTHTHTHTHKLDISQKGSKSEVSLHSLKICIGKEDRWHLWVNGRILVVEMPEFTSLPLS